MYWWQHPAEFRLSDSFLSTYKTLTPPFGFNGLGELTYRRTYSRLKPDVTNEVWWETVRRVVEGTYRMQERWVKANHLPWDKRKAQLSAQEMYDRMFHMKFLPPGRGLWAMGSVLTEERGLFAALNNCGFVTTEDLDRDFEEPFVWLMEASMLGIGVGFDTKGAGKLLVQPRNPDTDPTTEYRITDDREGWVESVRRQLQYWLRPEYTNRPVFVYDDIRPEGAPIRGFGGVSAGPAPLRDLHEMLERVLRLAAGQPLDVRHIVDIQNLIGRTIVAGNVRRTAEIAFGEADDSVFLDLKNAEVYPERNHRDTGWAWLSNNSVFASQGMDYTPAADRIQRNGEPGFAWLGNMQAYGRMSEPPNDRDHRARGGNPCLEQTLESFELCTLCETFPARHESLEDYQRTMKVAYLYAKTVTLGPTPWGRTNAVLLRNRRIGLSQSGIVQALSRLGVETYRQWCEGTYQYLQHLDEVYSDWLAIPRSIKTTSVKPSGTTSLLAGATPGMHYPESRTYLRRMRLSRFSSLVRPLQEAGYTVEPCVGAEDTTFVVEIPVRIEDDIRVASEVSMWEQLALAAFLQAHWADNQVSCTVTFDPVLEGPQIPHALDYYQYQLKGVSFLPRVPAGAYPQMPYEAISDAEYERRAALLQPLHLDAGREDAVAEKFCTNDGCVI